MNRILVIFLGIIMLTSCSDNDQLRLHFEKKGRSVPAFQADSAYRFVQKQVSTGPRTPDSPAHRQTLNYLVNKLSHYAGERNVFTQHFTHIGYNQDTLHLANIIAAFNTKSPDRIMLCAHWDSRPRADEDSVDSDQPILGADDGASGTAVLLELARLLSSRAPHIGVDLVLLDGEDYGREGSLEQYFLGSRYWSEHPPVKNYHPRFGILLDMVGGHNARFPKEQYSMAFAPALVNELWSIADEKGYGAAFPDQTGGRISDDHVVINRIRNIPTIDIVRHSIEQNRVKFAPYWHTHNDNMQNIDRKTLRAVGNVLAELIYNRL